MAYYLKRLHGTEHGVTLWTVYNNIAVNVLSYRCGCVILADMKATCGELQGVISYIVIQSAFSYTFPSPLTTKACIGCIKNSKYCNSGFYSYRVRAFAVELLK